MLNPDIGLRGDLWGGAEGRCRTFSLVARALEAVSAVGEVLVRSGTPGYAVTL